MLKHNHSLKNGGGGTPLKLSISGSTLAEVLITLGIIGVVAAMTIPMLLANMTGLRYRSQFTLIFHDAIVEPATNAARYVLNTTK